MKGIEVAREEGFDVIFLGALRSSDQSREDVWNGVPIRRLGILYLRSSVFYLIGTPIFGVSVFFWLLRNRPQIVHASHVEAMMGVALYRLLGGKTHVLFNIHDNFALRFNVPRSVKKVLARYESFIGSFAHVVLVPDETRLRLLSPWSPKRPMIIPNTPPDPGYQPKECDGTLRIFAPGWLHWQRGYQTLGSLVRERDDVELTICGGGGTRDIVKYLQSLPHTQFYGYVSQEKALQIGSSCDVVFAYYDPKVEINRYASSNKVFDALALGRPVIVNERIQVAAWVREKGVGFCLPYDDVAALSSLVDRLLSRPRLLEEMGRRARSLYEAEYRWEIFKPRIRRAFGM